MNIFKKFLGSNNKNKINKTKKIYAAAHTDIGKIRKNNEDNFYLPGFLPEIADVDNKNGFSKDYLKNLKDLEEFESKDLEKTKSEFEIFAVCDGMGGIDLGEVASYTVVSELYKSTENIKKLCYEKFKENSSFDFKLESDFKEIMLEYLGEINKKCGYIKNMKGESAGSTISMICIFNNNAYSINVGDSRIFLFRNKKLKKLSEEHTYARLLYLRGEISESEIESHESAHVLTQYAGMPNDNKNKIYNFEPFISDIIELETEDLFLISSDGLTDMISETEIANILNKNNKLIKSGNLKNLKLVCKKLIDAALNKGGEDNVTAMLIRYE